jgi:hypothetical protein
MSLRLIIKRILYFFIPSTKNNKKKIFIFISWHGNFFYHVSYKDLFNLWVPGKEFSEFMTSTRLTRKQLSV